MAFLEDPRLRQRWNRISHNAEGVAENAAAGIWIFQHRYIGPCLSRVGGALDSCTAVCLGGDSEERARRQRERERGARRTRAEYSFDFYDDWDDDDDLLAGYGYGSGRYEYRYAADDGGPGTGAPSGGGGGSWDWDRLLAGTGSTSRNKQVGSAGDFFGAHDRGDAVVDHQPRRKRTMSYGTRGAASRRKISAQEDPTVIPSTASIGFLGRLPFRIGGTLRYKPSAANLRDHPGIGMGPSAHPDEHEPLLSGSGEGEGEREEDGYAVGSPKEHYYQRHQPLQQQHHQQKRQPDQQQPHHDHYEQRPGLADSEDDVLHNPRTRKRSSTSGSGTTTSDSYRSRGDLFPSDGEGEEDAVPLQDDEFAVALDRVAADDRSSAKTGRSKGKRRADSSNASRSNFSQSNSNVAISSMNNFNDSSNNDDNKIVRSVSRTTSASSAISVAPSHTSLNKRTGSTGSLISATGAAVSMEEDTSLVVNQAPRQHQQEQRMEGEDEVAMNDGIPEPPVSMMTGDGVVGEARVPGSIPDKEEREGQEKADRYDPSTTPIPKPPTTENSETGHIPSAPTLPEYEEAFYAAKLPRFR